MNDDDLRRALHDATSEVHPHGDFAAVRARVQRETPPARRWLGPTVAAAASIALVLGGITWFAQHQQRATPTATTGDDGGPDSPGAVASTGPGRDLTVTTWFVGPGAAGPRLFSERHVLGDVHGTDLDAAVSNAVEQGPDDPDYRAWPEGLQAFASTDDSTIVVDLSDAAPRPAGMSDAEARMLLQSLVWTADEASRTDRPVRFTVDGRPVASLLGVPVGAPLSRTSPDDTLAMVSVSSPQQAEPVSSPFTVQGRANAFEANVVWELRQGSTVVRQGYATAQECCTLAPYSFTVSAPPGTYTLVVHDTDESGGEGHGTNEDTKEITVR